MKKILLSCVTCLLAVGLLAGCEDEVEEVTPEEPDTSIVEPGDDDGGSTEPGGTGGTGVTSSGIGGALPTELEGEWLLGYTAGEVDYYFNGEVESSYYGGVTTSDFDAVVVTVTAVSEGATLTFEADGTTEYINMKESDGHHNFSWSEEPFTWKYDEVYETFVVDDSEGTAYFMGNYGTQYQELRMSEYGYLTGEIESSNAQYPAHLYEVPTYVAPTSITISGESTVAVGGRITLTATIEGEGNVDPRLVWDWSTVEGGEVTVSTTGVVLGVTEGTVTVTATSVKDTSISGSIAITVTEASGDAPTTYKLGALDKVEYTYRWFNGSSSTNLSTTENWEEAVEVYITAIDDGIDNTCTLSFYNANGNLKYISAGSSAATTSIADNPCTWYWNETYQLFALGTTVGGGSAQDRGLAYYQSSHDIRAYATTSSNITTYSWVNAFTEQPADPEKPETPELTQVTSLTSGESYYLGAESNGVYHLITGAIQSYELATTDDFSSAVQVVANGSDADGWKLTIASGTNHGNYIYVMLYTNTSGSTLEIGLSSETTVPSSGVNVFKWSSTNSTLYQESVYSSDSYKCVYFEYYNSVVQPYGASSETSTFSNAAHFYQAVDAD